MLEVALLHKGVADTVCMIVLSYAKQDSATLAKVSALSPEELSPQRQETQAAVSYPQLAQV
jgi:hypothetical protein